SFPPPRTLVPEIPEDLELVIFQMMATDRRFRYGSAHECAQDLALVLEGKPVEVPRLIETSRNTEWKLLPATTFLMGREPTCDIAVPEKSVSRQHARLVRDSAGFVLQDLGSSYGTFVGDVKIKKE